MLQGNRILAIVPARGGSKGVPLKNLRQLAGIPLVARVGNLIDSLPCVDRWVVSTDHEEIARVAESAGLSAPFRRPESLSGDRIGDLEVLTHALLEIERLDDVRYDIVLMLQPTSPLRQPEHIASTLEKLVAEDRDSVWTVSPTDPKFHPLKALEIGEDGRMTHFDPRGNAIIARQQLRPVYHRNGVAYAIRRTCLLDQKSIVGENAAALVIRKTLVNIDTLEDFERAERLLGGSN